MKEIWKDIPGFEDLYKVSNFGRVKSLPKTISDTGRAGTRRLRRYPERIMKANVGKEGYPRVNLYKFNTVTQFKIHRLVALLFVANPHNLRYVNHKDKNPKNNRFDNLEWCTQAENILHGKRKPAQYTGVTKHSKTTWKAVVTIDRKLYYLGSFKSPEAAREAYRNKLAEHNVQNRYAR